MAVSQQTNSPLVHCIIHLWMSVAEKDGVTRLNIGHWSGRAGLLAASQLPLVTALGTKNNVVSCGGFLAPFSA